MYVYYAQNSTVYVNYTYIDTSFLEDLIYMGGKK